MKKLLSLLIAVLFIFSGVSAFAAHPATLTSAEGSTASNLIVVRKPETTNSATTKTVYGITGVGKSGVSVAFYRFDGTIYRQMNIDTTIGAAGLFYKQVSLYEGHNKFIVRAEGVDGSCQLVYFDINVLKQEILNNIRTFTYDMQSVFNGWLN